VSARLRITAIVAVAAAAAAATAVAAAVLTGGEARNERLAGAPPLFLDLGYRSDAEALALRRAAQLFGRTRELSAEGREPARRLFARYRSPQARVGAAFAAWPVRTLPELQELARRRPGSAFLRLHLGLAQLWAGANPAAVEAWRLAIRVEPDSASAVQASNFLHPTLPPGRPGFVPSFGLPRDVRRLPVERQFGALAERAGRGDVRALLLHGVALQGLGRPVSAERQFSRAASLAPRAVEAQVAAAVGRFSKDRPELSFSLLGPLARRFPGAATVHFHLGLVLLWTGRKESARRQLVLARDASKTSPLSRQAGDFLRALAPAGQR